MSYLNGEGQKFRLFFEGFPEKIGRMGVAPKHGKIKENFRAPLEKLLGVRIPKSTRLFRTGDCLRLQGFPIFVQGNEVFLNRKNGKVLDYQLQSFEEIPIKLVKGKANARQVLISTERDTATSIGPVRSLNALLAKKGLKIYNKI